MIIGFGALPEKHLLKRYFTRIQAIQAFLGKLYKEFIFLAVLVAGIGFSLVPAFAENAKIAVAANFTATANELAKDFQARTGHKAILSFGSTGKLYAQIIHGAPFDVFLSADRTRPRKLEEDGHGVPLSRFTYAYGQIALWTRDKTLLGDKEFSDVTIPALLEENRLTRLAVANPKTAPYGLAAEQYLKKIGIYDQIKGKTVYGENIAQTYQFAYTGNAEVAIVAYAQVLGKPRGTSWLIPQESYEPLGQEAVLLKKGQYNEAALAFMAYLKSRDAAVIITKFGYTLEPR
ncbi:molybdate ABC transporter substrate-binding protein [Kiloniella litopenaei]|uniref:molybdate ABC transporter substrate-binding protein n=1 Tax=Kiloniella litopenaei TaxID=1549748 RepID=UPI000A45DAE5|nr:molybdate ABC transporter substrate-binding protein [Kiloniella litopenaei]